MKILKIDEQMCELLKDFSQNYADGITAIGAIGALLLSAITLWYLRKEFLAKYKPYIVPIVNVKAGINLSFNVNITPKNVGPHPCMFRLENIKLIIGDEKYDTPNNQEWMLLAPGNVAIVIPVGHINEIGITKIRNNNYRTNRIELQFTLHAKSIHDSFKKTEDYSYEINVTGEEPQALFRPEWRKER